MDDQTLRYRAVHRYTYAAALLRLVELARAHTGPAFAFGPLSLDAMEDQGLEVSGPDLAAVTDVLAGVPGLVASPD